MSDNPDESIGMDSEGELDPRMVTGAKRLTDDMRRSSLPRWEGLRRRLTAERVNPSDAAVGFLYPDDVKLEMGLIVARDGRAFQFALEWWYDEEGNEIPSPDHAWVSEWEELVPSKISAMDQEIVAVARTVLREDDS